MGDNDKDFTQRVAALLQAGIISTDAAMRMLGLQTEITVPAYRPAVGDVLDLGGQRATVTRYDPENRAVDVFTAAGEALHISEADFMFHSDPSLLSQARAAVAAARSGPIVLPRPLEEPQRVEEPPPVVTVTRERAIMLD